MSNWNNDAISIFIKQQLNLNVSKPMIICNITDCLNFINILRVKYCDTKLQKKCQCSQNTLFSRKQRVRR